MPTAISGTAEAVVDAPPDRCAAALRNVEAYPRWYDTLDEARRVGNDEIELVAALTIATVTLRFELTDELPDTLEARQVGGDGRIVEAAYTWRLEPLDDDRTRAVYAFSATAASRTLKLALRAPATRKLAEHDLIHGAPSALATYLQR